MICVSIAEENADECIKALDGLDFAEIRLDKIRELPPEQIRRIFSANARLIATCRPGTIDSTKRKKRLLEAIEAGAAYVDIEVEASDLLKDEIIKAAREKGARVIVSYHNHRRTPSEAELQQVISWCFDSGADIAKVACKVNNIKDNARLLGLLDTEREVVIIGMGELGRITRVIAPLLGSSFTFASLSAGKETADGQIEHGKMRDLIGKLEDIV
jgi:3-dehydroquinate dehydratase-1